MHLAMVIGKKVDRRGVNAQETATNYKGARVDCLFKHDKGLSFDFQHSDGGGASPFSSLLHMFSRIGVLPYNVVSARWQ